jgi:hypothetical protein
LRRNGSSWSPLQCPGEDDSCETLIVDMFNDFTWPFVSLTMSICLQTTRRQMLEEALHDPQVYRHTRMVDTECNLSVLYEIIQPMILAKLLAPPCFTPLASVPQFLKHAFQELRGGKEWSDDVHPRYKFNPNSGHPLPSTLQKDFPSR